MLRKPPIVNAGSTADIAFLLLIFFLVSTTMETDTGIMRKLPTMSSETTKQVKDRNVFQVYLNSNDELMVKEDQIPVQALRSRVKDFLTPRPQKSKDNKYAETKTINLDGIGEIYKSKGIISLTNDRGTSYKMYITVQNEVTAAIYDLRNDFAKQHYGVTYRDLLNAKADDKIEIIREAIPVSISEAEPVSFGL